MQEYITIKEASQLTGKSDATIRRLLRRKLDSAYAEAMQMIKQTKTPSGFVYTMDRVFLEREGLLPTQPPTQNQDVPKQTDDSAYADDQADVEETLETGAVTGGHPPRQTPRQEGGGVQSQPLIEALAGTIDVLKNQLTTKDDQLATRDRQIGRLIEDRERTDILLGNLQNRIGVLEAPADRHEQAIETQVNDAEDKAEDMEPASAETTADAPDQATDTTDEAAGEPADNPQKEAEEPISEEPEEPISEEVGESPKRRRLWPFSRN